MLLPHFDSVIATAYLNNPRAVPADKLARIIREQQTIANSKAEVVVSPLPLDAWHLAQQFAQETKGSDPLICITGSFFIAAELRRPLSEGV